MPSKHDENTKAKAVRFVCEHGDDGTVRLSRLSKC